MAKISFEFFAVEDNAMSLTQINSAQLGSILQEEHTDIASLVWLF